MMAAPTLAELAAIRVAYAAITAGSSPTSYIVEQGVYAISAAGMLMDPEVAEELRTLRARVAELTAELDSTSTALAREERLSGDHDDAPAVCDCDGGYVRYQARDGEFVELRCRACPPPDAAPVGEPAGSPAALVASTLAGIDDVTSVTVDDDTTVTVRVQPLDLDGWRWWLGRFQVPVSSITSRGSATTAKGSAPGGVTVLIVGHGIAALQAPAVAYITQRGGEQA